MADAAVSNSGIPSDQLLPLLSQLGLGVAQLRPDGSWLTCNAALSAITGLSRDALFATKFSELFSFDIERTDADPGEFLAGADKKSYETSFTRRDGAVVWVKIAISSLFALAANEPTSVLMIVEDITARKNAELARTQFGGHMIDAIEAERSRIARELHDDICQSLAILSFQLMRAGKIISDDPGRKHPDANELCKNVQAIASRVSKLSHRLHSGALEYVGLESSITRMCREFTDERKIPVECTCDQVPRQLEHKVALCCLRVIQEAINNIAKHSRAKHAKVILTGGPVAIQIVIIDDGVGFDTEAARLARGIGLISMSERVRLVGGEFNLSSEPGRGTTIHCSVPLATT